MLIGYILDGLRGARVGLTHGLADELFHDSDAKLWLKLLTAKTRQNRA